MDAIREQLNKPLVVGVVAFIIGLLIGWFLIGWGIWPVKFVGAYPRDLVQEQKVEYLRQSIEAYAYNGDVAKAQARFNSLETGKEAAFSTIVQDPQGLPLETISAFGLVVGVQAPGAPPATVPPDSEGAPPTQPEEGDGSEKSLLARLWPVLCVIVLIVAAALIYLFIFRGRQVAGGDETPAMQAQQAARQAAWTDYTATGAEPPTSQFMASYKMGDDLFDDSFSIDSPVGEFLGECGVGISDTVGVGDPKKVAAFEVWLFDKNDIQTVTKVIMSANAMSDAAVSQRLEAKGEPVLAEAGGETVLETQTLQMVARVVDMGYGSDGSLPAQSYFDHLILELAIWPK